VYFVFKKAAFIEGEKHRLCRKWSLLRFQFSFRRRSSSFLLRIKLRRTRWRTSPPSLTPFDQLPPSPSAFAKAMADQRLRRTSRRTSCVKALVACRCWIPGPRFSRPGRTGANGCVRLSSMRPIPHAPMPSSPFPAFPLLRQTVGRPPRKINSLIQPKKLALSLCNPINSARIF